VQWWAEDSRASSTVSVVVHADSTSQAFGPRPIFWHLDIAPAEGAAGATVLWADELEGWFAFHGSALDACASIRCTIARGVNWVLEA